MKIAQIAPIVERVPPKAYGGTERVIYNLTEELVNRGHEVTIFATGDSKTSAKLSSVYGQGLRESDHIEPHTRAALSMLHVVNAYSKQDKFDLIHDHTGYLGAGLAEFARVPVVITMHGRITEITKNIFEKLKRPRLVTISKSQKNSATNLNHSGTIYNGLKMNHYPFSANTDGYLLYVGRVYRKKGTHLAVEVARRLNLPLIIAAKIEGEQNQRYFDKFIKPYLNDKIRWVGEVGEKERNKLYSRALCFLHPITWKEPFGLTLIEAMACGCPVVAFRRGSIPEVIEDGKTGFIVKNLEDMISAVKKISLIKREDCRFYSLSRFNEKVMADQYEEMFYRILEEKYGKNDNLLFNNNNLREPLNNFYL